MSGSNSPRSLRGRRGFALPLAILALALMTATIVAAYSTTSAETVANNAMRSQERALQLAQTGLQQFYVRRSEAGFCSLTLTTLSYCVPDPSTADSEWTRVTLPGGYADVVAMRQRQRFSSLGIAAVYFMRATGVDTGVKLSGAGNAVYARRTIGQYATWGTTPVRVIGGLTSLNGLRNNATGGGERIDGDDFCGGGASVPGVVVPRGGLYGGTGTLPGGSVPVDSTMTLDSLRKVIGIDWQGIIVNNALPADITIPGGSFPTALAFALGGSTYWPVIRIKNNYTLPNDGKGLIIADSNLVVPAGVDWDGIILVGGAISVTGTGTLEGVVITGLNRMLSTTANPYDFTGRRDTVSSTKRIRYNSCDVGDTADKLKIYFAMTNTFIDNVAIW